MMTKNIIRQFIYNTVKAVDSELIIGGSWKYNDFHFNGDISFSDLDLLFVNLPESTKIEYIRTLELQLSKYNIDVSIHTQNKLEHMSFDKACQLILPEYLIQRIKNQNHFRANKKIYLDSKFILLSLRKNTRQRYRDITLDEELSIFRPLLDVKLGNSTDYPKHIQNKLEHYINKGLFNYIMTPYITSTMLEKEMEKLTSKNPQDYLITNLENKIAQLCF